MVRQRKIMFILVVLLILALSYIVFDQYTSIKQRVQLGIYQEGAQFGYEQAIFQVMQQAATCQPVPLFFNNQTINVVAVECLQAVEQQVNITQ